MIESITLRGWALIILFVAFVIGLNMSIFLSFRKKKGQDHWTDRMHAAGEVLRDPWKQENAQLNELAEKVKKLNSEPDSEEKEIS